MKKFEGIVVSTGMKNTIVVEVFRKTPHPLYRKLIKRSKKFNVDNAGFENVVVGEIVKIVETRPISKNKYFKVLEVVDKKSKNTKASKKEVIREEPKTEIKEDMVEVAKTTKKVAKKTAKPSEAKISKDKKESN